MKTWYAVQRDNEDNDWGYGSYDYDEAVQMLKDQDWQDGKIAVIEESECDSLCVEEIAFKDLD